MIEISRNPQASKDDTRIKILGLGSAGSNALDRILLDGLDGAEMVAINTDAQSLTSSVATAKVQLGRMTTRGLGAGGDPEIGYEAAQEGEEEIRAAIAGAELIFLCVGLGGGTGSGAAPMVAHLSREQGALVVVFATMPFSFEGKRRLAQAEATLTALQEYADVVICFENDKMGDAVSPRASIQDAFAAADQTISQSVRAIAGLLQRPGLLRVGFDELRTALRGQQARSLFGFGEADGDNRAHTALERALRCPLMDRGRMLQDVDSVLVHVVGGPNMTLNEVQILMEELNRHISDTTRILFGTAVDPRMGNRMSVMLLSALGGEILVRSSVPQRITRVEPSVAFAEELPRKAKAPAVEPVVAHVKEDPALATIPDEVTIVNPPPPSPPAPVITPEPEPLLAVAAAPASPRAQTRVLKQNGTTPAKAREMKQEQMSFEPVTRGRFEKSEPTIIDGQDLDVPTYLRRNVKVK